MEYTISLLEQEIFAYQVKIETYLKDYPLSKKHKGHWVNKEILRFNDMISEYKTTLKILNAQDKSRSVTLQEESKEECDHKYQEVNWGDISYNKCYSCGKIEDKHSG